MQEMLDTPMSSISQSHRRKHSGELDVFEATRYFSGMADAHKTVARRAMRGDRRSLDMPLDAKVPPLPHQKVELMSHNMVKDKVRCKQPSSPGCKLASFLNSFFQQYSNSKKSKKSSSSSSSKPVNDQQKSNSRRKMSSMSSTILHEYSKSCYYYSSCSSSSCWFRTPSLNNNSKKRMSEGFRDNNEVSIWGDEFRLKVRLGDDLKIIKKEEDQFEFRDQKMDDNGGESDSSSDLFELKINLYEFGEINSSGSLPVYGSTDVGVIRSRERFASTVAY